MYYVEKEIQVTAGIEIKTLRFFRIIQLRFDYLNTEFEIQIAGYKSKEEFKKNPKGPASKIFSIIVDYTDEEQDYNVDPNLFAWRKLISGSSTIFYKAEIKKAYDMNDPNW